MTKTTGYSDVGKELDLDYYMAGRQTYLSAESVTEQYDRKQLRAMLMRFLARLPDEEVEVIALRFGLGLTRERIGASWEFTGNG